MSKKSIIALITVIVLLFAAGISVGVFLYSKGTTQAAEGNQTTDQVQTPNVDNEVVDENQTIDNTDNLVADNNDNTQNVDSENANNNVANDNVTNNDTTADTVVGGLRDTTANTANTTTNAVSTEVGATATTEATTNDATTNETGTTDNTGVDEIGETTITRVEEQERLISESFWDWWKPMRVAVKPTEIGVELPQISVIKIATVDGEIKNLVYEKQEITYTIAVTNNGENAVENIEVTDRIPEKTTYVDGSIKDAYVAVVENGKSELKTVENASNSIITSNDEVIGLKWNTTIQAGETVFVSFVVKVNEEETGTIFNSAIANGIESNETQTSIIKNHKSAVVKRQEENSLEYKEVELAKVGDIITFTITVENTGILSGNVNITDKIPAGTELVSTDLNVDEEGTITWSNVKVPAATEVNGEIVNGKAEVTFDVKVVKINKEIENVATVNDKETNKVIIKTADIKIEKEVSSIKRGDEYIDFKNDDFEGVIEGDIIEYLIRVTNTGSVDLTNVIVTDLLEGIIINPDDLDIGDLDVGDFVDIKATYNVEYEKDILGNEKREIYNLAAVNGETKPDPKNPDKEPERVYDEDDVTVPVAQDSRISITKTETAVKQKEATTFTKVTLDNKNILKVRPGDIVEYTIIVTNTGNTTLTNVIVTDTLDVKVEGSEETTVAGKPILTIDTFAPAESVTIKTYYTVKNSDVEIEEPIKNVAKVTAKTPKKEEITDQDDELVPVNVDISVSGTKTWDDNNNEKGKRPSSITIKLFADTNKEPIKTTTIEPSGENGEWKNTETYEFKNLPKYNQGTQINYTIEEEYITDYRPTNEITTNEDGGKTINIKNTFEQDISGQIISIKESDIPLDVVFVLDISSSMLDKDAQSQKTKVQNMVEATNTAIAKLMENTNNRVSIVLFNSYVYNLTGDLAHYTLPTGTSKYISYGHVGSTDIGGKITFLNRTSSSIDVSTAKRDGGKYCGTYTQGGIKEATKIFAKNAQGDRKPVMILLTDGDPTHYDTVTTDTSYGIKYPTADRLNGIGIVRFVTAEYYSHTIETMKNCKNLITGYYKNKSNNSKPCEVYTVGINMKGSMAKTLLNPSENNINKLNNNPEISADVHNGKNDKEKVWNEGLSNYCNGEKLLGAEYYRYQSKELYRLLGGGTGTTYNYPNATYTESNSDNLSNKFTDIIEKIQEKTTIDITAELYGTDRKIKLDGYKSCVSLEIINQNGEKINNPKQYIIKENGDWYLKLTDLKGKLNVKMTYKKY